MTTPKLFHQDDINYVQSLTTAEFSIGATDLEILRYSSDVKETIRKRLLEDEDGSTYCFINLENVLSQIKRWFKMFPGVQPFYGNKFHKSSYKMFSRRWDIKILDIHTCYGI